MPRTKIVKGQAKDIVNNLPYGPQWIGTIDAAPSQDAAYQAIHDISLTP